MGVIANRAGVRVTLGARSRIGRGADCALRLEDARVSAEHAVLHWHRDAWHLRDLGSTNGTFVNGERLRPGESRGVSAGARIELASSPDELGFVLVDDGPPRPLARGETDGAVREAVGELLVLPDADAPMVMVFPDEGGWIADRGDTQEIVVDQQLIHVDSRAWRLELPPRTCAALPTTHRAGSEDAGPLLAASRLLFRVSRDEEYVELTLLQGSARIPVPPRSHHTLLLYLARRRLEDEASGVPVGEQGWTYADELADELDLSRTHLNLAVCRARQQLAELGVAGAGGVIERRSTTRQLRLGGGAIEVTAF